jgi:hypothetical protein
MDSTSLLVLATFALVGITGYYAIQTRLLTKNQLRPTFSRSLTGQTQNMDSPFEMALHLKNVGIGPAFNINVELSIVGIRDSNQTQMIRDMEPNMERYVPLVQNGQPLLNDRGANRVIKIKLKYEGISGKYHDNFQLIENDFFSR